MILLCILFICFTAIAISYMTCETAKNIGKMKYTPMCREDISTEEVQKTLDEEAEKEETISYDAIVRRAQYLIDEEEFDE